MTNNGRNRNPKFGKTYFVGSLPGLVDKEYLKVYFSQFGAVQSLELVTKKKSHLCKGYGFLKISLAITEANFLSIRHAFMNRRIFIRPHLTGENLSQGRLEYALKRLFVVNLPDHVTERELKQYFEQFGEVELAYISPHYENNVVKSLIGLVTFDDKNTVAKVLSQELHIIRNQRVICSAFKAKPFRPTMPQFQAENYPANQWVSEAIEPSGFISTKSSMNYRSMMDDSKHDTQKISATASITPTNMNQTKILVHKTNVMTLDKSDSKLFTLQTFHDELVLLKAKTPQTASHTPCSFREAAARQSVNRISLFADRCCSKQQHKTDSSISMKSAQYLQNSDTIMNNHARSNIKYNLPSPAL